MRAHLLGSTFAVALTFPSLAWAAPPAKSSASAVVDEQGSPVDPNKVHPDPSPPVAAEPAQTIDSWADGCFASYPSGGYAKVDCPVELDGAAPGSNITREGSDCFVSRAEEAARRPAKCPDVLVNKAIPGQSPPPSLGRQTHCGRCNVGSDPREDFQAISLFACLVATCLWRRRITSPCRGTP